MFFSIPNYRSTVVSAIPDPWNLRTNTPPPYELGPEAVADFCGRVTTEHAHISMFEGKNPGVVVSMRDNPPVRMHGLIVTYDNPPIQTSVEALLARRPVAAEFLPSYLVTTATGSGRMVWEFEQPVLFSTDEHMRLFVRLMVQKMRLDRWLSGIVTQSPAAWAQYYELGQKWEPVPGATVVPLLTLKQWFFDTAENIAFDSGASDVVGIPMLNIYREVESRWPGIWSGPFIIGAEGPAFWTANEADRGTAMVLPDGMLSITGDAPSFRTWEQLLGEEFVAKFSASTLDKFTKGVVYDGSSFWLRGDSGEWANWSRTDFIQELRVRGCNPKRKAGHTCSEVDGVEIHIKHHQRVAGAAPLLFFPKGVTDFRGQRFLNTSTIAAIPPSPPLTRERMTFSDGQKCFPNVYRLLRDMLSDDITQSGQLAFFLSWLKLAYVSALDCSPRPGQVVVIAGAAGRSVPFLCWQVINRLLGGRTNAAGGLMDGCISEAILADSPVITLNDPMAMSDFTTAKTFVSRLAKLTDNPQSICGRTKAAQISNPWFGRIIITCVMGVRTINISPSPTLSRKLCIFRALDPNLNLGEWFEDDEVFGSELPMFGRFLVDWVIPDQCIGTDARYGSAAYRHPSTVAPVQVFDVNIAKEVVSAFAAEFARANPGARHWKGNDGDLFTHVRGVYPAVTREFSAIGFVRAVGALVGDGDLIQKEWSVERDEWVWVVTPQVKVES